MNTENDHYKVGPSNCMVLHSVIMLSNAILSPNQSSSMTQKNVFKGEEVDIIDGSRVLGSVIGNRQYIEDQKQNYLRILQKLAKHAKIAPQNVYKCLTNSVQHKIAFLSRTKPDTFDLLEEAEKVINDRLIPNLVCNTNYDETYRDIFSLPVREGELNIIRP